MNIEWMRPSGNMIVTNDLPATIAHCESMEWKRVDAKKTPAPGDSDMTLEERQAKIKEAVAMVLDAGEPDSLMKSGAPNVDAVEALLEMDITADERNAAYSKIMEERK